MIISTRNSGFSFIATLTTIAVIAALAGGGLYYREIQKQKSVMQIGLEAEKKANELKKTIEEKQKELQKEMNGQTQARFITSQEVDASGWKTYQNQSLGYEIKYPADWKQLSCLAGIELFLYSPLVSMQNEGCGDRRGIMSSFNITDISNCPTCDPVKASGIGDVGSKTVQLNGVVGTRFYNSQTSRYLDKVVISSGEKRFTLFLKDISPITEKILSTFKFIGQNPINTSTWKTYRNEKYGFKLWYPPQFEATSSGPSEYALDYDSGKMIPHLDLATYDIIDIYSQESGFEVRIMPTPYKKLDKSYPVAEPCGTQFGEGELIENSIVIYNGVELLRRKQTTPDRLILTYCFISTNKLLTIGYRGPDGRGSYDKAQDSEIEKLLHGVVSTLEVFTPSIRLDTSLRETYRNEKYGFEVKYPSNWKIRLDEVLYDDTGPSEYVFSLGTSNDDTFNVQVGPRGEKLDCKSTVGFQNPNPDMPTWPGLEKVYCVDNFKISLDVNKDNSNLAGVERTLDTIAQTFQVLK